MIKVEITLNNDNIQSFIVSGHADSGPYGYDLVCAAVSAVTFGVVNAVFELTDVELNIEQGQDGGYLKVELPHNLSNLSLSTAYLLFKGMLISLQTIERDYGDHIYISFEKEGE